MIVDSSAFLAVVLGEPDAAVYAQALQSPDLAMSTATWLEVRIVTDRSSDPVVSARADELFRGIGIDLVPVTFEQAEVARRAHADFGRGTGHPAGLNYGDCFSYALAKVRREPLLFKGDDFVHTDIRSALG